MQQGLECVSVIAQPYCNLWILWQSTSAQPVDVGLLETYITRWYVNHRWALNMNMTIEKQPILKTTCPPDSSLDSIRSVNRDFGIPKKTTSM